MGRVAPPTVLRAQRREVYPHFDDVARLKAILARNGYAADDEEIAAAWARYSDAHGAGWLVLQGGDEYALHALLAYMEPVSG